MQVRLLALDPLNRSRHIKEAPRDADFRLTNTTWNTASSSA